MKLKTANRRVAPQPPSVNLGTCQPSTVDARLLPGPNPERCPATDVAHGVGLGETQHYQPKRQILYDALRKIGSGEADRRSGNIRHIAFFCEAQAKYLTRLFCWGYERFIRFQDKKTAAFLLRETLDRSRLVGRGDDAVAHETSENVGKLHVYCMRYRRKVPERGFRVRVPSTQISTSNLPHVGIVDAVQL